MRERVYRLRHGAVNSAMVPTARMSFVLSRAVVESDQERTTGRGSESEDIVFEARTPTPNEDDACERWHFRF